jgi:alcohol dehydrogenase class IV
MYERIQQLPVNTRKGHDAIFDGSYLNDIPAALKEWEATRVLLVVSTTLDTKSMVIKDLEARLGDLAYVDKKVGVGSHSPYADTIDIAHRVQQNSIDAVVCIGSGSYSDSCKTAVMLSATLSLGFSYDDMESLVDQKRGLAGPENLTSPTTKLICVPTSLSSGEWNHYASGTNSEGKKQHFMQEDGAPTLIICDPRVAATTPRDLWLASGMRAVDHFVETMCSPKFTHEATPYVKLGLGNLLKGLVEYCENKSDGPPSEGLLQGISDCQRGSRLALFAWIFMKVAFGTSHALGHQLVSNPLDIKRK